MAVTTESLLLMLLAILDDDSLAHPPIEAVFTVDEEIGMLGADYMDASDLKGRLFLNIDSEDEGVLSVSCADGGDGSLHDSGKEGRCRGQCDSHFSQRFPRRTFRCGDQ